MINSSKFRVSRFPCRVWKGFRTVRAKLPNLIEQWQRICILAERIIRRREAAAVRGPQLLRRVYLPTHFPTTPFSPTPDASSTLSGFSPASSIPPLSDSILSSDDQADLSRLTSGFRVLNEVNQPMCWRGNGCDLANGLKQSIETVAQHLQNQADLVDHRVRLF
jgi:sorting nexin-8